MSAIAYATGLTRNMAQIHVDGDYVGLLFKEADYVGDGGPFYLIDLHDDPRGPVLVRNRALLTEMVEAGRSTDGAKLYNRLKLRVG